MSLRSANQGGCPKCLNPSTVGRNLGGDNYTGKDNPLDYDGITPNYTMPLMSLTDGPSLGHDRRYDRVGGQGFQTLLKDPRTSVIDLRFIYEQLGIVINPKSDNISRGKSIPVAIGFSIFAIPKMIDQSFNPSSWAVSLAWYHYSNIGVMFHLNK